MRCLGSKTQVKVHRRLLSINMVEESRGSHHASKEIFVDIRIRIRTHGDHKGPILLLSQCPTNSLRMGLTNEDLAQKSEMEQKITKHHKLSLFYGIGIRYREGQEALFNDEGFNILSMPPVRKYKGIRNL